MSQTLYRKYRSKRLSEVVGQEHITSLLEASIAADSIHHAYLLTGPHGVGKTSTARIIAHQINQLPYEDESSHLDIIEIDAASNNGVDDVRELRDKAHTAPTSARYKVYIIDEVHMLSRQAFNALLKTLEEPPAHVVFILATTDADKLPSTIISRVQRFNFRAIPEPKVIDHLKYIAKNEQITIADDALKLIARHGGGSFRDSIGLLDQMRHSSDNITLADVENSLGIASGDTIDGLITAYRAGSLEDLAVNIRQLDNEGAQASIVTKQLIDKLHADIVNHPEDLSTVSKLLEVSRSPYPFIKLLTVLAPVDQQPKSNIPPVRQPSPKTMAQEVQAEKVVIEAELETPTPSPESKPAASQAVAPSGQPLDWQTLLDTIKPDSIAVHSLLLKSQYDTSEGQLKIYAGKSFLAKQLSTTKSLAILHQALEANGHSGLEISILASAMPPKDAQTAAIADIMGGGEEVEIDG